MLVWRSDAMNGSRWANEGRAQYPMIRFFVRFTPLVPDRWIGKANLYTSSELTTRLERRRQTESHLPQSPPKRGRDVSRP